MKLCCRYFCLLPTSTVMFRECNLREEKSVASKNLAVPLTLVFRVLPPHAPPVEEILEIDLPMHKHCGILPPAEWSGGGTRNTSLRQSEGRRNFISWRLCRAGSMRSVTILQIYFFPSRIFRQANVFEISVFAVNLSKRCKSPCHSNPPNRSNRI